MFFFTAKVSMSAQSSQRECNNNEGMQEFGGAFADIAVAFAASVVKIDRNS